ncbi:MAG: cytochrome c3 family protein, partial [Sulfurimonas sp.]
MKYSWFFILKIVVVMLSVSVFAQGAVLTDAEKFYGTELKASKKVQHPPFEWGDCTVCHTDAKGEGALIMDPPELCAMCHEAKDTKAFIHGPVAAGACTACHNPHESDNAKLLTASSINELCVSCHQAKDEFMRNTANIHSPVKDQCINCHDPHTEDHQYQLKADGKKDLCVMCHVDKEVWTSTVTDKHGALDRPRKCLECHDAHGSEVPMNLIKNTSKELCLSCHSESLTRDEDGSKILNIGKHLENNPDWHGPILWGDCAACHNPHGSNNLRMLNKPFPRTFYDKFEEDNYICFQCHEKEKIMDANTTTATNF